MIRAAREFTSPEDQPPRRTAVPQVSGWLFRWFTWYTERYLARNFHAVRVAGASRAEVPLDRPLIVFMNHAAWWDPLIGLLLAARLFSTRTHYAPMEAAALGRYGFFRRLGFFGVEPGTPQGGRQFLRTALAILDDSDRALWLTPEGRFSDPRQRPVRFQPGLAHLARRLERGVLLPLAVEYPFWEERLPEAVAAFGEPVSVEAYHGMTIDQWNQLLQQKLEATQDHLAALALRQEPSDFRTVLQGSAGVGGFYDGWRRLRAWLHGETFQPEHGGRD